jgi:hypothetical protein
MRPDDQWTSYRASTSPVVASMPQARTGLIALTAFLVELVVIAAVGNQGFSDDINRFYFRHPGAFAGQVARASQTYAWRVSSERGAPHHFVLSQYAVLATLFVVTAAVTVAVVRGDVRFGRVFLGVWSTVIAATQIAAVVGVLVANPHDPRSSVFSDAVFLGPSGYTFFAGLSLGLLTGLIAALVAMASRRPVPTAPVAPSDPPSGGVVAAPSAYPERDREQDNFATTSYPAYAPPPAPRLPPWAGSPQAAEPSAPTVEERKPASDETTQIPRMPPPSDDPNKTTMLPATFPRPPDDEDPSRRPE